MTLILSILLSINLLNSNKPDTTVLNMVNEIRVENGISAVTYNPLLGKSSMSKACDMEAKKYFSHISPDGRFWKFIEEAGYHYVIAGENLAKDCTDEDCVTLWMNSQKHKDIILDSRFREGAISRCGNSLVLHFGTNLTLKETLQIMIFRIKAILKQETILKIINI